MDIPIVFGEDVKCMVCGKKVIAGYPAHPQCARDFVKTRLYTAEDIVPFKFPPYQEMVELIAFKHPNPATVRTKGCYITFYFSKNKKELEAVFFSTRFGFPAGRKTEPNTPEGYQRICDWGIEHKYEAALSFIE